MMANDEPGSAVGRAAQAGRGKDRDRTLHLGCLVAPKTHNVVRAYAAERGITIRRLLLTALQNAGVPIPAREIEEGHR